MPSILERYRQIRHIKSLDDMWRACYVCVCRCLCVCDEEDAELYLSARKETDLTPASRSVRGQPLKRLSIARPAHKHPHKRTRTQPSFRLFWPSTCPVYRANNLDKQCRREILRRYLPLHTFGAHSRVFAKFCRSASQCKMVVDRCKPWVINTTHMDWLRWKHRVVCSSGKPCSSNFHEMNWWMTCFFMGGKYCLRLKREMDHFKTHWIIWKMYRHKEENRFFHPLASIWCFFISGRWTWTPHHDGLIQGWPKFGWTGK